MIDDHPDLGPDPLAGRDPHPREQIDLWPPHDARQELLEEIVSQAGPGNAAAPSTRRLLLPVGIAAALAIVAGGAWFVVGSADDGDGRTDNTSVAASDDLTPPEVTTDQTTDPTTDPTTEPSTEPAEPDQSGPGDKRRLSDVRGLRDCTRLLRRLDSDEIEALPRAKSRGKHGLLLYLVDEERRYLAVNEDCEVVRLHRRDGRP